MIITTDGAMWTSEQAGASIRTHPVYLDFDPSSDAQDLGQTHANSSCRHGSCKRHRALECNERLNGLVICWKVGASFPRVFLHFGLL